MRRIRAGGEGEESRIGIHPRLGGGHRRSPEGSAACGAPGLRLFWSREMREETGFIERDSFIVGIVVKI
jgi:hypothetical protein